MPVLQKLQGSRLPISSHLYSPGGDWEAGYKSRCSFWAAINVNGPVSVQMFCPRVDTRFFFFGVKQSSVCSKIAWKI